MGQISRIVEPVGEFPREPVPGLELLRESLREPILTIGVCILDSAASL
jgi:hypothetical protein